MTTIDGKDDATRKAHPIFSGLLKYFPDACLEVAALSKIANDKHNPGQPLHWSRHKSSDHGDCLVRHQLDTGMWDVVQTPAGPVKVRHSAEVAWRALAQLQLEIEADQVQVINAVVDWDGRERRNGAPTRRIKGFNNTDHRRRVSMASGRRNADYIAQTVALIPSCG